ncbi:hypothetical protein PHSC3_001078 [Chlamydiales bacterium STE3]|nr:hypothetical protein PHSC3_001078 [Chlamydiales bacterium STE3]
MTLNDLKELEKVAYHDFLANLVIDSEELKQALFNWVIRDQNDALAIIQFPSLVERLNACHLNGRISCHGGNLLKIQKIKSAPHIFQKIVTLPFEGKEVNILDENKIVHFSGHVFSTIAQVFEIFKNKDFKVGNFEFMKEGIINWNIYQLGYWDELKQKYVQIGLDSPDWWRQLPLFAILSEDQIKLRYGWTVKCREWIAAAAATRGAPSLSYEQTHAFLELAIPLGKGLYGVYDFGKLAYRYCSSAVSFESETRLGNNGAYQRRYSNCAIL